MKEIADQMSNFKPLWDAIEPFKSNEIKLERGVPLTHPEIGKFVLYLMNFS
jgi:hypothetical protein